MICFSTTEQSKSKTDDLVFSYQIKDRSGTTSPKTAVGSFHWLANQVRIGIEHLFGTYAWLMKFVL